MCIIYSSLLSFFKKGSLLFLWSVSLEGWTARNKAIENIDQVNRKKKTEEKNNPWNSIKKTTEHIKYTKKDKLDER